MSLFGVSHLMHKQPNEVNNIAGYLAAIGRLFVMSCLVHSGLVWALSLSASDPYISPPTGSRWQHVKRVSTVGVMYSTLKLKTLGDFRFNHKAVK